MDLLKYTHDTMFKANKDELFKMSLCNVHADGLYSIVIENNDGKLLRVFYASKRIKPYDIALHTHMYDLELFVVDGGVIHHDAKIVLTPDKKMTVSLPMYSYTSGLKNNNASFVYQGKFHFKLYDKNLPITSLIELSSLDIHSVSCSKGSMWIVKEGDYKSDNNIILGKMFDCKNMYSKITHKEFNDIFDLIVNKLEKIL